MEDQGFWPIKGVCREWLVFRRRGIIGGQQQLFWRRRKLLRGRILGKLVIEICGRKMKM